MTQQYSSNAPSSEWIGRIAPTESWQKNKEGSNFTPLEGKKGWGGRYKVRIIGWNTPDKTQLPDEELVMANVILPTTAGGGIGGFTDTASLAAGTVVTGKFMDGVEGRQAYITGVIPNSNNEVPQSQEAKNKPFGNGFNHFTDLWKVALKTKSGFVPDYRIRTDKEGDFKIFQTIDGDHLSSIFAYEEQLYDLKIKEALDNPCKKKNAPMKGIQTTIEKLLNGVERIKKITGQLSAFQNKVQYYTDKIKKLVDDSTTIISGFMKKILQDVRGYMHNKIQNGAKKIIPALFPPEIPDLTQKVDKALNALGCLFNKKISGLIPFVKGGLENILDKFVGSPLCASQSLIQNFLGGPANPANIVAEGGSFGVTAGAALGATSALQGGDILGAATAVAGAVGGQAGQVAGVVNAVQTGNLSGIPGGGFLSELAGTFSNAMGPILNFANSITGAVGKVVASVFNAIDYFTGLLSFFKCDDEPACPDYDKLSLQKPPSAGEVGGGAGGTGISGTGSINENQAATAPATAAGGGADVQRDTTTLGQQTENLSVGGSNAETQAAAAAERELVKNSLELY